MGVKKKSSKKTKVKKGGSKVAKAVSGLFKGKKGGGGGIRRSRQTPEKLAKKILVERLKKKLYKVKYGGR